MTSTRAILAAVAALTLVLVLASCGGGGSTTVTGNAVNGSAMTRKLGQQPLRTYLADAAGRRLVEPATYRFPGDGDLTAKELDWHDWGDAKATASGTIAEHPANGLVDTFSGSVTASAPRRCKGAAYYTEVMAHVPKQADFVPTHPTKLTTPCD